MKRALPYMTVLAVSAAAVPATAQAPSGRPRLFGQAGNGQNARLAATPPEERQPGAFREIKRFDFNERPQGNFERVPMFWTRLEGPGLPGYADGRFDERVGYQAPPSFRLDLAGGNVAYVYERRDLSIESKSDYYVVGHIRAEGLVHSRAFIAASLLDRFGNRIPGSAQVSDLAGGDESDTWRRVELVLPGDSPEAARIRLELWIAQRFIWADPEGVGLDPIVRQDVRGTAWFDDIAVYRLPRARLTLSNPGSFVAPGATEHFILDMHNHGLNAMTARLTIRELAGETVRTVDLEVPPLLSHELTTPVPELPPGHYSAELSLGAGEQAILRRRLDFAVLAELPEGANLPTFGIDLGTWRSGGVDVAGVQALLAESGTGAAKVAVPALGALSTEEKAAYFEEIAELVRRIERDVIDATGVILTGSAAIDGLNGPSTRSFLALDVNWRNRLSPILAHFGSAFRAWQLGDEAIELRGGGRWNGEEVRDARDQFRRFVTAPKIIVPTLPDQNAPGADARSIWVPSSIPTRGLPLYLAGMVAEVSRERAAGTEARPTDAQAGTEARPTDAQAGTEARPTDARAGTEARPTDAQVGTKRRSTGAPARTVARSANSTAGEQPGVWVKLEAEQEPAMAWERRIMSLARRIVLAKALSPERLYIDAPFELTTSGGDLSWSPLPTYSAVRTLFHHLGRKQAVGVLTSTDDAVAIVFDGGGASCVVMWTWREGGPPVELSYYLGAKPVMSDLWGRRTPLTPQNEITTIELTPAPVIVENVDAALAQLHASFTLSRTFLQIHEPDPKPVLSFRNYFNEQMEGTVMLTPPERWTIEPVKIEFSLDPGETLEQVIDFRIPPRHLADTRELKIDVDLRNPRPTRLMRSIPLTIGLKDIAMTETTKLRGGALVVEQVLTNNSAEAVNFWGFCQAPNRPRKEHAFLSLKPGDSSRHEYVLTNGRELIGQQLHMGLREIRGSRTLDKLVDVR